MNFVTLLLKRQTSGNDGASNRLRRIGINIISATKNETYFKFKLDEKWKLLTLHKTFCALSPAIPKFKAP